jgi:hypothetical protein
MVENLANGKLSGTATTETGIYKLEVPAEVEDRLAIYYYQGLERSQSIVVLVPDVADSGGSLGGAGGASP